MSVKPIYEPRGAAKEYGDLAVNLYTGCPHACFYCFAPLVTRKDRIDFHTKIETRPEIVEKIRRQLEREKIIGKLIHLCFTCDPYPTGYDSTPTRDVIRLLKAHGNHVQILTKGDGSRDLDLLDENDWYGITIDGSEDDDEMAMRRTRALCDAHRRGIKTWISYEPVVNAENVIRSIRQMAAIGIDRIKIGKLNYYPSEINWAWFGRTVEALCRSLGIDYYIKDSLRAEMEKETGGRE